MKRKTLVDPYYSTDRIWLYNCDCLDIMRDLPENSIDCMVTDPPYGLSFMGEKWDYDVPSVEIWRECLKVLKPGAHALIFAGSRTQHRMAVNVEDAGFIIKDCLMWLYGSGFPKSTDISKQIDKRAGKKRVVIGNVVRSPKSKGCYDAMKGNNAITAPATPEAQIWSGWGTHLKPAYEPILLVMKPNDGTYANNALKHGVAGINVDAGRIGTETRRNPQAGFIRRGRTDKEIFNGTDKNKPTGTIETKGRFPANIILDEEAAAALDKQSGVLTSGASRFFYCAKASKKERGVGNNHPTVKPIKLTKYLCNLLKPPGGGVIIDPFAGSGTTGLSSDSNCVLIEKDKSSCDIIINRLNEKEKTSRSAAY
jgi:site-specific DNA-methyltransferase (adenine-specific)